MKNSNGVPIMVFFTEKLANIFSERDSLFKEWSKNQSSREADAQFFSSLSKLSSQISHCLTIRDQFALCSFNKEDPNFILSKAISDLKSEAFNEEHFDTSDKMILAVSKVRGSSIAQLALELSDFS